MAIKITISDRVWLPLKYVERDKLDEMYIRDVFNDKMCKICPHLPDRPSEICQTCEGYKGSYKLYKIKSDEDGREIVGLPVGSKRKIKELIDGRDTKIIDKRALPEMRSKFKFKEESLFDFQVEALDKLEKAGYGLLQSAPRTGKTVIGSALIGRKKTRTLILVHQDDLAKQFRETLKDPKFTNVSELEEKGKTVITIATTFKDFFKGDIVITNYQKFLSTLGKKRLKKITRKFGLLLIDEVHRGNASGYSQVINQFKSRYRFGMTATPNRKDGMDFIIEDIVGPVTHKTTAKPMTAIVKVVDTKIFPKRNYHLWTSAMRFLEGERQRNELIVKHVLKDLKKGHSIIIPVTFQSHADTLVTMIRDALNESPDVNDRSGLDTVEKFTGKVSKEVRRQIILGARKGKVKCIVAMRSMLLGVNVPRWSMIYEVIPMNNDPNFEQEVLRICTIYKDKPQPCIKFFIDDFNISRACFKSCSGTLNRLHKEYGGFRFTPKSWKRAKQHFMLYYASLKKRSSGAEKDDEFFASTKVNTRSNISF